MWILRELCRIHSDEGVVLIIRTWYVLMQEALREALQEA
jgi:hypothetical protein